MNMMHNIKFYLKQFLAFCQVFLSFFLSFRFKRCSLESCFFMIVVFFFTSSYYTSVLKIDRTLILKSISFPSRYNNPEKCLRQHTIEVGMDKIEMWMSGSYSSTSWWKRSTVEVLNFYPRGIVRTQGHKYGRWILNWYPRGVVRPRDVLK